MLRRACVGLCLQANAVDSQVPVVLDSLSGRNLLLKLRKRPGREAEDVLGDDKGVGETTFAAIFCSALPPICMLVCRATLYAASQHTAE